MFRLEWLLLCCAAALVFPSATWAGNWDKYLAIYNRFYLLDKQPITQVSCSINVPNLYRFVQLIRAQVAATGEGLIVSDTLDNYGIVYKTTTGLSITDPTLAITSITASNSAIQGNSPQAADQASRTAFALIIHALDSSLKDLFSDLQTPKPGNIDIYYVTENKGVDTVSYGTSGAQIVATFDADSSAMKITNRLFTTEIRFSYDKMPDGKLLLSGTQATAKRLFDTDNSTSTVTYQKIGNLKFPAQIVTHSKLVGVDMQQTSQVTINIQDCKLQ